MSSASESNISASAATSRRRQDSSFPDLGNLCDDREDIDLTDLHYTVGSGFRWKLESFVKTGLFLDYACDVEEQDDKLCGGTWLNFQPGPFVHW